MNDSQIIELYFLRDKEAIKQTAIKYGGRLRKLATNILNNYEDAEECENDTYTQAWLLIPPNNPSEYFFPFLAKIIRHISLDVCKKRQSQKRCVQYVELSKELEECIASPNDVEEYIDYEELCRTIGCFLNNQTDEKKFIFLRRYWFMDSISEIEKRTGLSESKVKTTLHRLRNELKLYLQKEGYVL